MRVTAAQGQLMELYQPALLLNPPDHFQGVHTHSLYSFLHVNIQTVPTMSEKPENLSKLLGKLSESFSIICFLEKPHNIVSSRSVGTCPYVLEIT